jgi:hypothetical protein
MTNIKKIKKHSQELSSLIADTLEDYLDQHNLSPQEEHNIVVNALLTLTTYPLEDISPEHRQEAIDTFLSVARENMESFHSFLRKELKEGN